MLDYHKKILLIEDDDHLRIMLITALSEYGYIVSFAKTAKAGFQIAKEALCDIILLDLGLPDYNGIDLIPMLKTINQTPIIIISAQDKEQQKIIALDNGADDYLTKPFGVGELLARIRATLRRSIQHQQQQINHYDYQGLSIDLDKHSILLDQQVIHLTPVEFQIIAVLVQNTGKVVTQRQLLREVWGPTHEQDNHYLRIYMRQIRRKIEQNSADPQYIITEPNVGYRLNYE